jgi:subtilisin family serine protease
MLLCAAAGEGDGEIQFPAACSADFKDNVVSVGAIYPDDSPLGPLDVDVFAPGANVRSTTPAHLSNGGHYDSYSGTSLAAPFVSGVAALIWSRFPALTAGELKQRIMATARVVSGRRILNAAAALE